MAQGIQIRRIKAADIFEITLIQESILKKKVPLKNHSVKTGIHRVIGVRIEGRGRKWNLGI